MATHSSVFAWRIPWTEDPGGLKSMGLKSWTQLNDQTTNDNSGSLYLRNLLFSLKWGSIYMNSEVPDTRFVSRIKSPGFLVCFETSVFISRPCSMFLFRKQEYQHNCVFLHRLLQPLHVFESVLKCVSCCVSKQARVSCSVMSDSLRPHGLQPRQAPLSMGCSRQEYWSELPFPSPGDLPDPGTEPASPVLQVESLLSEPPEKLLLQMRSFTPENEKYCWLIVFCSGWACMFPCCFLNTLALSNWFP